MRVSKEQAVRNRERVIDVASRMFRRHGFDGIGVDGLMSEAGLTHGGFYKQFASKDDLAAAACRHAFENLEREWSEAVDGSEEPYAALVGKYFSVRHRADAEGGCPLATLAAEAARREGPLRSVFQDGIKGFVAQLARSLPGRSEASRREKGLEALAMMVGGVLLSRAVEDAPLADEIATIVERAARRIKPDG